MPGDQPFVPITLSSSGLSVTVAGVSTSSVNGSISVPVGAIAETLLVTNTGTVTLFVRMSREATPVATSTDVPLPNGASRVFGNPNPVGTSGVAVIGTGLGNGNIIFTPGNGGL